MHIQKALAALAIVATLVAAVALLGDAFRYAPATADTTVDDGRTTAETDPYGHVEATDVQGEDNHGKSDADHEDEQEGAHLAAEAALSIEEAIAIASEEVEGRAGEVELEREGGRLLYEIEFDSGYEVELDASTGEVVEVELEDDEEEDRDEGED